MTHLKQHASTFALIATLTATPAILAAQSATDPTDDAATATEQPMTQNDAEAPADPAVPADGANTAEVPVDDGMTADPNQTADVATEEPVKPVEGHIRMQSENTILADNLMGTNVYSTTGESIGKIDDLIVNLDGAVEGAVIGVGGFLGIGEKWVAVEMSSLSTQQDENGNVSLTSSATKADLEAAEPFVTAQDMAAAQRSVDTMPAEGEVQTQPIE